MKNKELMRSARVIEKTAADIRLLSDEYQDAKKSAVLRFAGSLCTMASSILCELYEVENSDFTVAKANNILRSWGMEEIQDA